MRVVVDELIEADRIHRRRRRAAFIAENHDVVAVFFGERHFFRHRRTVGVGVAFIVRLLVDFDGHDPGAELGFHEFADFADLSERCACVGEVVFVDDRVADHCRFDRRRVVDDVDHLACFGHDRAADDLTVAVVEQIGVSRFEEVLVHAVGDIRPRKNRLDIRVGAAEVRIRDGIHIVIDDIRNLVNRDKRPFTGDDDVFIAHNMVIRCIPAGEDIRAGQDALFVPDFDRVVNGCIDRVGLTLHIVVGVDRQRVNGRDRGIRGAPLIDDLVGCHAERFKFPGAGDDDVMIGNGAGSNVPAFKRVNAGWVAVGIGDVDRVVGRRGRGEFAADAVVCGIDRQQHFARRLRAGRPLIADVIDRGADLRDRESGFLIAVVGEDRLFVGFYQAAGIGVAQRNAVGDRFLFVNRAGVPVQNAVRDGCAFDIHAVVIDVVAHRIRNGALHGGHNLGSNRGQQRIQCGAAGCRRIFIRAEDFLHHSNVGVERDAVERDVLRAGVCGGFHGCGFRRAVHGRAVAVRARAVQGRFAVADDDDEVLVALFFGEHAGRGGNALLHIGAFVAADGGRFVNRIVDRRFVLAGERGQTEVGVRQRAEADDAEVRGQTLIQERLHHGLRRVACNLRTDQIAGIFVPIAVGMIMFVADRAFIRVAEKMEALPCAAGVMRVNMLHLAAAEDVGILCHGRGFVQHQNDVGVRRRGGDAAGFDFQGDIE